MTIHDSMNLGILGLGLMSNELDGCSVQRKRANKSLYAIDPIITESLDI